MAAYAFNFHGVGTPGQHISVAERRYWVSVDRFEEIANLLVPHKNNVTITFDDGNRSDLDIAAPILSKLGLVARIFPLTGRLDNSDHLSPSDLRTLFEMGFVIGSHGINHVDWAASDPVTLENEVRASKARLEDILGQPVREAAVPFGSYNRKVLHALAKAGYDTVWTSDGAHTRPSGFLRPRLSIKTDTKPQDMARLIAHGVPPTQRLRQSLSISRKRLI